MTFYLRNPQNETLADVEVLKDAYGNHADIRVVVCIGPYSRFLIELLPHLQATKFVADFERLQELRGEWFESVAPNRVDGRPPILYFVRTRMRALAEYWSLSYVED